MEGVPGGLDVRPRITSVVRSNEVLLKWLGVQGPYQVQQSSSLNGGAWTDVGPPVVGSEAKITTKDPNAFFRIAGAHPQFQGNDACFECHGDILNGWAKTAHGRAFDTLKKVKQENNPQCVVCHTVGAGMPSGFISEAATPQFLNVQCENCHGPAGDHLASGETPTVFPIVYRSSTLCGGCHNGFHHPTHDEWKSSPHSAVVPELAEEFDVPDRAASVARMNTCGACHSGAVRLAMLSAYRANTGANRTNVVWPSGKDAAETPVACMVCHEVHGANTFTNVINGEVYTRQLRNPLTSTNVFSYNTGTNFAANYNPAVSVCGQCHNARGASIGGTSRPPHYSPQYNVYLGIIGVTGDTPAPQGAHRNNPNQCAGCHTHGHESGTPSPNNPVYTGHAFRATIAACQVCHTNSVGTLSATNLLFTTQAEISGMISDTKNLLDLWATSKNTNAWAAKYEKRGWEFTTPGELSNPSGSPTIVGPTSAEQAQIPQGIKEARFNLYLVNRDKSRGIHNAPYVRHLLKVSQQKVQALLSQ